MIQQSDPERPTELLPRPAVRSGSRSTPVFVDASGLRRRVARRIAAGVFLAAGAYSLLVIWSLIGGPVAPDSILPFAAAPNPASSHTRPSTTSAQAAQSAQSADAARSHAMTPASSTAAASAAGAGPASPSASKTSASPDSSTTNPGHKPTSAPGKPSKTGTPGHGH